MSKNLERIEIEILESVDRIFEKQIDEAVMNSKDMDEMTYAVGRILKNKDEVLDIIEGYYIKETIMED